MSGIITMGDLKKAIKDKPDDIELVEDYPLYYNDDGESVSVLSIHKKTLSYRGGDYVEVFPRQYGNFKHGSEIIQSLREQNEIMKDEDKDK